MLGQFRKFSSSVYAKVFLFIVAIPFVFWGMGPVFQGGKLNTIAEIGKKKISTDEFINFVNYYSPKEQNIDSKLIDKLLSNFVAEKLISQEIDNLNIRLSDISLSEIIKNEKLFKKENEFSRTEYEKFLIQSNLNAVSFEANILEQEKREQLFDFIGGGVYPSDFLIANSYNRINQKRNIELIELKNVFKAKTNFTEDKILEFYNKNKNLYEDVHKTIKFIKLEPKNLAGNDDYSSLFFEKLDEIEDLIIEEKNLDFILNNFNLKNANSITFKASEKKKKLETSINFPEELIEKVFNFNENEPLVLLENKNEYFLIELTKTQNVQRQYSDKSVKEEITNALSQEEIRKNVSDIIIKINKNEFKKADFDKFSQEKNAPIKKIKVENQNDNKLLKLNIIKEIYSYPEKKVILVSDLSLKENFLVYINSIENAFIDKNSKDYNKYVVLSEARIVNSLYNTYDFYLKNKYKIKINYKALDKVKNSIK